MSVKIEDLSPEILIEAEFRFYLETIPANHFNYLLEACGIGEEYHVLPLSLKQVEYSLTAVSLSIEADDDGDDVANKLTSEFLSIGVRFFYISSSKIKKGTNLRYETEGIFSSEFKPDTYSIDIYITDTFIENLSLDAGPKLLAPAVLASIKHEDTHKQQYKLSRGKVKGLRTNTSVRELNLQDKEHIKEYLSLPSEIDAQARELARSLHETGWKGDAIITAIKRNPSPLLRFPIFRQYWEVFGKDTKLSLTNNSSEKSKPNKIKPLTTKEGKIWNSFLREVVSYLNITGRYKTRSNIPFKDA